MCNRLKLECLNKQIGNIYALKNDKIEVIKEDRSIISAPWLGFIRGEREIDSSFQEKVQLKGVSEYREEETNFTIPQGKTIEAVLTIRNTLPEGKGIFIITRPATKEEKEKCPHPRHPKLVVKKTN